MKKGVFFSVISVLMFCLSGFNASVSADVLIPIAKNVWLETKQDYPDFDFYVGTFQRTSYYDQGRHYKTLYDSLKLTPAQLTAKTPYLITSDFYEKDEELHLIAVKKDAGFKDAEDLKSKIIPVAKGEKNAKILLGRLNYQDTGGNNRKSERSKTYTLNSLSETEIKTSERYGEPTTILSDTIPVLNGGYSNYLSIVIGLLMAALITAGGLFFFRRR